MPAPTRTRVPVEKVTVTLPATLYREISEVVRSDGGWLSSIDFIREASREKLERYKAAHGGQIPFPPGTVTMPERKRREGDR